MICGLLHWREDLKIIYPPLRLKVKGHPSPQELPAGFFLIYYLKEHFNLPNFCPKAIHNLALI